MKEVCPHNLVACFLCNNHVVCNCPDCHDRKEQKQKCTMFQGYCDCAKHSIYPTIEQVDSWENEIRWHPYDIDLVHWVGKVIKAKQKQVCQKMIEYMENNTGLDALDAIECAKEYLDSIS